MVAGGALVLQLVLVIIGNPVLDQVEPPGPAVRLYRFFAYFTIQSNLLVAIAATSLARDPDRDGAAWRVLRLAGVVGITVTGIVHFLLLRPLLDLHGWDYAADKLLHLAVPVLAVVGLGGLRSQRTGLGSCDRPRPALAAGLAGLDTRGRRAEWMVPLPVPRPPRGRLGGGGRHLRGDPGPRPGAHGRRAHRGPASRDQPMPLGSLPSLPSLGPTGR